MKLIKGNTTYREKLPKHGDFKNRYEFPALHKCPISGNVRPYTANYHPEFEIGDLVYWSEPLHNIAGSIVAREKANNRELGTHMWLYTVALDAPRHAGSTGGGMVPINPKHSDTIKTFALTRSRNPYEGNCQHLLTERTGGNDA